MSETSELAAKLAHRNAVNEGEAEVQFIKAPQNVYTEFKEFTRRQIKEYEKIFLKYSTSVRKVDSSWSGPLTEPGRPHVLRQAVGGSNTFFISGNSKPLFEYDVDKDKVISQKELQVMMEKIGAPQTFLGLKAMIKEVDEDGDGAISFREFLLIFRKAAAGELAEDSGLSQLAQLTEIDVDETGVGGAKDFFEAKIIQAGASSKYEQELKMEQEERKREAEEAKKKKEAFKAKREAFQSF